MQSIYLGSCSERPDLWHLISLRKMDIEKEDHTSFKSRTTDVGAMVSVRISYTYDESLWISNNDNMAILLFRSRIPQSSSSRRPPHSQSLPHSQMASATTAWSESRSASVNLLRVPLPNLKIVLTFTQLLFLLPQLSIPHLCSIGYFPFIY